MRNYFPMKAGSSNSLLGGFSSLLYLGVSSFVRISSRFIYFKNKTVSKAKSWYSYSHNIKRLANRSSRTLHRLMNLRNEEAWTWTRNQKTVNKNHVRKCYCCTAKEKHKQTNKQKHLFCVFIVVWEITTATRRVAASPAPAQQAQCMSHICHGCYDFNLETWKMFYYKLQRLFIFLSEQKE